MTGGWGERGGGGREVRAQGEGGGGEGDHSQDDVTALHIEHGTKDLSLQSASAFNASERPLGRLPIKGSEARLFSGSTFPFVEHNTSLLCLIACDL